MTHLKLHFGVKDSVDNNGGHFLSEILIFDELKNNTCSSLYIFMTFTIFVCIYMGSGSVTVTVECRLKQS